MDFYVFIVLGSIQIFCLCLGVHMVVAEQLGAPLRQLLVLPRRQHRSESASGP